MSETPIRLRGAVQHIGCHYLAQEDSVCNKCGQYIKPYETLERELTAARARIAELEKPGMVSVPASLQCEARDGHCILCGSSLPLDGSCWKGLAAAKGGK
jgi:hypothetical protein